MADVKLTITIPEAVYQLAEEARLAHPVWNGTAMAPAFASVEAKIVDLLLATWAHHFEKAKEMDPAVIALRSQVDALNAQIAAKEVVGLKVDKA